MSKRKPTPNVLDELLPGPASQKSSDETPEAPPAAKAGKRPRGGRAAEATVPPRSARAEAPAADASASYERTSTGYRKGTGETVRRVSFFLTDAQRRELKTRAAAAGYDDLSSYLVDVLNL